MAAILYFFFFGAAGGGGPAEEIGIAGSDRTELVIAADGGQTIRVELGAE